MINFRLRWHPRFSIYNIEGGDAIFLGDREQFLLNKTDYEDVHAIISRHGKLYDYVFLTNDITEQVSRIEKIDRFISDKILIHDNEKEHSYSIPDFSCPIETSLHGTYNVYLLSTIIDKPIIDDWLLSTSVPDGLSVVIVDDYLDPRILNISEYLSQNKLNWLILKPVGRMAMAGPYFNVSDIDAPCYHCLHSRLTLNNPVREWYRRQTGSNSHPAVPIMSDIASIKSVLDNFTRHYLSNLRLASNSGHILYSIDTDEADKNIGDFHNVMKRPQCRSCGDNDLFKRLNDVPLRLADCPRHDDTDGGYRNISREDTLHNIRNLISPVTGIVTELKEITTKSHPDEMAIFQAAYFQNTYHYKRFTPDTFVQLSLGKGVSKQQAMSSAMGEALERQAAQFNGEESIIFSTPAELRHRAFSPRTLAQFSPTQYKTFTHFKATSLNNPQWVTEFNEETPIHWVRGWSLTKDEHVYFPAAYCFANTPFKDHEYSLYTHNGNAAGNTSEEAILQGTLEVIERDAVAIWWYNQIPRPEIALETVPEESRQMISNTLADSWDYWLLDISHDISVVSCVAVGRHKESEQFALGFGSHMDASIACQRALTEMHQLITIKDKVTGPFDFNKIPPHPFIFPRRDATVKTVTNFKRTESLNIRENILSLIETLRNLGLELCVVNYSRPDIDLKTLKVIIPGLCHFWPQLANQRLYDVPVSLGWLSKRLKEEELNPLELYL